MTTIGENWQDFRAAQHALADWCQSQKLSTEQAVPLLIASAATYLAAQCRTKKELQKQIDKFSTILSGVALSDFKYKRSRPDLRAIDDEINED